MCVIKKIMKRTGTKLSFWGYRAIRIDQPRLSSNNTVHLSECKKTHSAPTGNKTVHSQTLKSPEMSYDESKSVWKHLQLQCWTKFIERGRSIHWHYSSQDIQAHWNYCMLRVSGVAQRHGRWIRHTENRTNQCSHTVSCEETNQLPKLSGEPTTHHAFKNRKTSWFETRKCLRI